MNILKNIYLATALASAVALGSCSTDDDVFSSSSQSSPAASGLYLTPTVKDADVNASVTSRADVASVYSLHESQIDEMYLAIGLEWAQGQSRTGQYYIFRKNGIELSPDGNVLMVEGKSWRDTIKAACGYNLANPVDVYVIANPREKFDATSGLSRVVSDLTKMKNYLQTPQEEKTEQGDNPIYKLYDATTNSNKNFLMYGHTRWTPNKDKDTATIYVKMDRAAAKIVANIVVNSADYEVVEDDTHKPSCTLTNYANSALPTEDFQYTVETETTSTTDGETTYSYSEEIVKEKLTANKTIAVETSSVPVSMEKGDGITGYTITTYSYPFSWASDATTAPKLKFTFYIKEKGSDDVIEKTDEITVTNTDVTALERNHIYTANYVINLLGKDVTVADPTVSYSLQEWSEDIVKGVNVVNTKKYSRTYPLSDAIYSITGFTWNDYSSIVVQYNNATLKKDSDGKYKIDKNTSNNKNHTYITLSEDGTVKVDMGGGMNEGDTFTFYVIDGNDTYQFTITYSANGTSDGTASKTEETAPEVTPTYALTAMSTTGYYYVDLSDTTGVSYVIAQPTASSYDVVSPAFVINANTSASVGQSETANNYTGWRLPTANELALINKMNPSIVSSSKYYKVIAGYLYSSTTYCKGDGTSSTETSGNTIAIHDLTATELQALK